jgi:hypothetical protein
MDYLPLALGLGTFAGLVTYIEITLRREKLSGLRARQSIIDRRLLSIKSAIERIERRLDAMTVDREVVDVGGRAVYSPAPPSCSVTVDGPVDKAAIAKLLDDELAAMAGRLAAVPQPVAPSRRPCLDCASVDAHTPDCALSMDDLVESPTDAAARRGRD